MIDLNASAVIVNPRAGRRKKDLEWLRTMVGEIRLTERPGHASALARELADRQTPAILVWGGDGTVNECLEALNGSPTALGLIPGGTGNDLSRHLGLPASPEEALKAIGSGRVIEADLARANGRPFLNILSCGFDAVVGRDVNRPGRMLKGTAAYVSSLVKSLATYQAVKARIEVDGEIEEREVMLCAVANGSCYGGGMKVAPGADISDGLLDVVVLEKVGKADFLRQFPKVFKGEHLSHPAVSVRRGRTVRISAPGLPVLCDGEEIGETPVEASLEPGRIRLIVP